LTVVPRLIVLVALAAPCGAAWGQPADQLAFVAANAVVRPPAGTQTPLKGIERKIAARDTTSLSRTATTSRNTT
jgi:hypothetical protein